MINVEMAKCLIDRNFFRIKEEGGGVLKEKLIHLSRMLLAKDTENEKLEGTEFAIYMTKDGINYNGEGKQSQGYHNIGCEEKGWSWCKITGPNDPSEYYYQDYFDKCDTTCFELVYGLYFEIFRFQDTEPSRKLVEHVLGMNTMKELEAYMDPMLGEVYDFHELIDMIKQDLDEEKKDDLQIHIKTLLLCAYYLYHHVNELVMDDKLCETMNANFRICFPETKRNGEEYMEVFLSVLDDLLECSHEGTSILMDLFLNVHFSYAMDHNEITPTLFCFMSKPLKEYKELREKYAGSELVTYLDKLVPMLEDPAFMFPGEGLDYMLLDPGACVVEYGYTDEEYVCGYYYYEKPWDSNQREYVNYDYAFSLARKCFEVLLEELKRQQL